MSRLPLIVLADDLTGAAEIAAIAHTAGVKWTLDDFVGYVGTWSATQRYTKVSGADPLPALRAEIAPLWDSDSRTVLWPLHLRVGRP